MIHEQDCTYIFEFNLMYLMSCSQTNNMYECILHPPNFVCFLICTSQANVHMELFLAILVEQLDLKILV